MTTSWSKKKMSNWHSRPNSAKSRGLQKQTAAHGRTPERTGDPRYQWKRVNRFSWKQENKFKTSHWKWGVSWKRTLTLPTGLLCWRPGGSQPGSHPPERSWQAVISNFITLKSRQSKTMTFQTIATETKRRTHTQKRIWKKNWEKTTRRKHGVGEKTHTFSVRE